MSSRVYGQEERVREHSGVGCCLSLTRTMTRQDAYLEHRFNTIVMGSSRIVSANCDNTPENERGYASLGCYIHAELGIPHNRECRLYHDMRTRVGTIVDTTEGRVLNDAVCLIKVRYSANRCMGRTDDYTLYGQIVVGSKVSRIVVHSARSSCHVIGIGG